MEQLRRENANLTAQLAKLNDNTIVQSMNDMKSELEKRTKQWNQRLLGLLKITKDLVRAGRGVAYTAEGALEAIREYAVDELDDEDLCDRVNNFSMVVGSKVKSLENHIQSYDDRKEFFEDACSVCGCSVDE